jgi:hypothetical protein
MRTRVYSTVDWRKYLDESYSPRVKAFLDSRGADVFNQLCGNMNRANSRKKEKVVLLVHPNAGNVIIINKADFDEVYDIALNWFLKNENYEMCSKIAEYKSNLIEPKIKQLKTVKSLI